MRRILMIVFAVLMILPGCQEKDDRAFFTQNNGLSVPGYEGTVTGGLCASVDFDDVPTTSCSRYYSNYGVFTFVLPHNLQSATAVSLGIYPIYENPFDGGGCTRDFALEFIVYPIIASDEDYAQWENCEYIWDGSGPNGGSCTKSPECEIMPAENFTAEPFTLPAPSFTAQLDDDGWLVLESQEFLTWLQNNFDGDEGVSFIIGTRVTWLSGDNMCGGPYAYPTVHYENSENILGTGNLPFLVFDRFVQFSIPRYDGREYGGPSSIHGVCFSCQTTAAVLPASGSNPIFTFKLSNLTQLKEVNLQLKVLAAQLKGVDAQLNKITIAVLLTNPQDYQTWQDCHYTGAEYSPDGCQMPDFIEDKEFLLVSYQPRAPGWYGLSSSSGEEFKNYLQQNFSQGDYLSIIITDFEFADPSISYFSVEFEDGENNGGSNEIPFMDFIY